MTIMLRPADLPHLRRLLPALIELMSDERVTAPWEGLLARESGEILVADDCCYHSGEGDSLYVSPHKQQVWLSWFCSDTPALAYYCARDWRPDGTLLGQPEDGPAELRLWRSAG